MVLEHWELQQRQKDNTAGAEVIQKVQRFSKEAILGLTKEGYNKIYPLSGQSIKSLREQGRKFWSIWHKDNLAFESLRSRLSEVTINPNRLFLPDSNYRSLDYQEAQIQEFSRQLCRKVPDIKVILGEMPDYMELAFLHLDATDERLFGAKYGNRSTRTKTPVTGSFAALFGHFDAVLGAYIDYWNRNHGLPHVWVSPLVVPA